MICGLIYEGTHMPQSAVGVTQQMSVLVFPTSQSKSLYFLITVVFKNKNLIKIQDGQNITNLLVFFLFFNLQYTLAHG